MNRRGHMSSKIPQVKLRPAPAPQAASAQTTSKSRKRQRESSPMNAMDAEILRRAMRETEDEESSTAALRRSSRPWKGVTITFTGVENKASLSALAKELGAVVEPALTIHVTHVVATSTGSPKYLYAVEHRLPVMNPSWIESAHAQWIQGDELDLHVDEETHRLLPFVGLRIAMSGIEQLDRRKILVKYITSNGGQYSKDLDRTCTHLISAKPTSDSRQSEKIKWALREISEREAMKRRGVRIDDEGMKIVYEEWIWDCVAYKGRWKEDYYDAKKPRMTGRVKAEDVINGTLEQPKEKRPVPLDGPADTAVDNEPAVMRRPRRSGLDSLVGELISTATTSTLKVEPTFHGELEAAAPDTDETFQKEVQQVQVHSATSKPETDRKSSMLHLSRSTSFAQPTPVTSTTMPALAGPSAAPGRSTSYNGNVPTSTISASGLPPTAPPATADLKHQLLSANRTADAPVSEGPVQFYAGLKFSHLIKEQCGGLENALVAHGGVLVSEAQRRQGEEVDYVIVRLNSDVRPTFRDDENATTIVTECWVEGCCFVEKLLSPDDHIVFRPLSAPMPVPGADKLLVHLSGFSAEHTVYMRRLLRAIGGTLSVKLTRHTSHLVSVHSTGQKVDKSREWGVSVVKDSWLLDMARSGTLANEDDHRHPLISAATAPAPSVRRSDLTANMSTVSDLGENVDFTRRLPPASARSAKPNGDGVSQTRMLGSHPTHVDEAQTQARSSVLTIQADDAPGSALALTNALSPPQAKTERLLNSASASASTIDAAANPSSAIPAFDASKIARYASAPAYSESVSGSPRGTPGESMGMKSASTGNLARDSGSGYGGGSGSAGANGMIEALKKLAEKEGGTPRNKVVRRSRPAARIKSTNTRSPHPMSLSPTSRRSSPTSPGKFTPTGPTGLHGPDGGMGMAVSSDGAEESMRVEYVDTNGLKERKKLMAMFTSAPAGVGLDGGGGSEEGRDSKRRKK